ncbi:peptidase domain-containing ABC transporter [Vibrio vulnificus]|uniref:RTX toxin transporter n=1 Tax=Vibrio vulnificus TaxID=672 RepID=A0AAN1PLQ4_VIBVL|nr:peptidase domain-containing ABC transporter [Vibrio vulnificus]AXX58820.1 RTX toxin transporter [Vibrio vulnificus]
MDVIKNNDILSKTIKKYYLSIIYIIILSSLLNILSLAMPLSFMAIIDRVLVSSGSSTLIFIAITLAIVSLFEAVIGYSKKYIYNWFSSKVISELSGKYFDKLMLLKLSFFKSTSTADHITRVGEIYNIKNYISNWLLSYLVDVIFLTVYTIVMLFVSPILTIIILSSTPFHIVQYFVFGGKIRYCNEEFFRKNVDLNNSMINSVNNIEMVKLTNCEMRASDSISKSLSGSLYEGFKLSNLQAMSNEISSTISKLFDVLLVVAGSYLVLNGHLSLGELVAFTLMKDKVVQPLIRLASLWEEYCQFKLSKNRVDKVFNETAERLIGNPIENINQIEFDSVSFHVNGKTIFRDVNLVCKEGKIVCIVGESGSGKSTLLKMIPRLIDPSSGVIYFDKYSTDRLDLTSLRNQISYVGQECHIFNGTIRQNILWSSNNKSDDWLTYIMEISHCSEFVDDLIEGVETYIGDGGMYLSGGQKQRIALARCFASDKKVVLLDEPTSALDEKNEYNIIDTIAKNSEGKITVVVSHNDRLINSSDIVYCL